MLIENKKTAVLVCGLPRASLLTRFKERKAEEIVVLEGRPDLSSSRRLCRKLLKMRITPTVMSDNMAGFLFYKKMVREVWLAYQDVDSEGMICSIGALVLAVLGKRHRVPVFGYPAGESRACMAAPRDIRSFQGTRVAPRGTVAYGPLLEWVPKKYVRKIHE